MLWETNDIYLEVTHLFSTEIDPKNAFAIGAAAEIPAGIVGMFLLRFLNRRSSMAGSLAVGSACSIATAFIPLSKLNLFWASNDARVKDQNIGGEKAIEFIAPIMIPLVFPGTPNLKLALSSVTRFFLTVATSIKWVYTLELLPTNIRSLGFALAFAVGRIGGMLAPFIRDLVRFRPCA